MVCVHFNVINQLFESLYANFESVSRDNKFKSQKVF